MEEQFTQHGAFSWCELMTTDVNAAKAFYTQLFGWDTEEMSMPGMTYTVIKAGDKGIGGIMAVPKEAQGMPPQDIPNVGRFCVIQDPQGAVISAITYIKM